MVKDSFLDKWLLYVLVGLFISIAIAIGFSLTWKGWIASILICEAVALIIFAIKIYNKPVDNSVKYHSLIECRKYIISWLRDNNSVEVVPFTSMLDSGEGRTVEGNLNKLNNLSHIYFGCFISTDTFPKYIFVAMNTQFVDNDSTFHDDVRFRNLPTLPSTSDYVSMKQDMCNSVADNPIRTKSQTVNSYIDPMGGVRTSHQDTTTADDDLLDDAEDVKK